MARVGGAMTYLAFDLGASSGRAVLGRLEGGRMAMESIHRFETPIVESGERLSWDLDTLWHELETGLDAALRSSPGLRSLSVDSWAVDYVPMDSAGVPVRPPRCYRDGRTEGVMERAFASLPAAEIYRHTGIQFLPFNTLFQLLADRYDDDPADRLAHRYLPIADYFNHRFGGRPVVEVSMASTTQLMDVHTRTWSAPIFDAFGLDRDRWPEIVDSGTPIGTVTGAPDVAVVASCSHDTGSAVVAAPATGRSGRSGRPGRWAYVSSGTWSLLGVERTEPRITDAAREAGFTHEAGADGTIRFLKNLTGLWALQECQREWGGVAWSTLEREARAADPRTARIALEDPAFLSRGAMADRLRSWCADHGQPVPGSRGQLVRVILESIAASYAGALGDLERVTGEPVEVLHIFGGGSRNRLLCQLAADAVGIPVIAGPAEATALGNLLVQARTLGDLPAGTGIRDLAARSTTLETYRPSHPIDAR